MSDAKPYMLEECDDSPAAGETLQVNHLRFVATVEALDAAQAEVEAWQEQAHVSVRRAEAAERERERDSARRQSAALQKALADCGICGGTGFYMRTPGCSRCDDSGEDHECDDAQVRAECVYCRRFIAALAECETKGTR